jgi:hypothetical protein
MRPLNCGALGVTVPVNYAVSTEDNLVLVTARGLVTRADMDDLHYQVLADPQIRPGMRMILEAASVDSQLSFSDLQEIAGRLGEIFERGIGKVAVVADSTYVYSLAKTFAIFAANEPVRMKPFRGREEAIQWLDSSQVSDDSHATTIEPQSVVDRDSSLVDVQASRRSLKRAG